MNQYILHIETAPLSKAELVLKAPVFRAAANLKDAVKIAEDIEKKKNKYFEDAAYSEITGYVCAVGLLDIETGKIETKTSLTCVEETILRWLYNKLKTIEGARTVTFRGCRFVYPFIARRAARYSEMNFFKDVFHTASLGEGTHLDLARVWACGSLSHPDSLSEITDVLGVDHPRKGVVYHQALTTSPGEASSYMDSCLCALLAVYNALK